MAITPMLQATTHICTTCMVRMVTRPLLLEGCGNIAPVREVDTRLRLYLSPHLRLAAGLRRLRCTHRPMVIIMVHRARWRHTLALVAFRQSYCHSITTLIITIIIHITGLVLHIRSLAEVLRRPRAWVLLLQLRHFRTLLTRNITTTHTHVCTRSVTVT
jgi:hypothetical protein